MITDRNKFNFVTICIGLCFLHTGVNVAYAQATSNAQQEANLQQTQQQIQQDESQAAIATISVADNNIKDEKTNAILNEPINGVAHAFSPRLDYSNEWRPVGRGDPLKNDPTFDYSPPTLEHVRYWAETTKDSSKEETGGVGKQDGNTLRHAQPNQKDILKLGMPNEHLRGGASVVHASSPSPHHQPHPSQHAVPHHPYHHQALHVGVGKNAKGEMPLLQPKYTSVRRSYYAQQLPTRLMPPPMQANSPPINTFNVPMKPSQVAQVHSEYRHSMPVSSQQHVSSMPNMGPSTSVPTQSVAHMKMQHYPSMSTPPASSSWMYSSPTVMHHYPQQPQQQHHHYVMSSGSAFSMPTSSQSSRMPISHVYDSHPQDSHHYFSYTRPSGSNSITSHMPQESHSPNSIWHSESNMKPSGTGRKPWLHELLQKEVVKTSAKPSYSTSASKYAYESTKPIYERMPSTTSSLNGGFTPITPVTYVSAPPTIATTTTTTSTTRVPPSSVAIAYTTPRIHYPVTSSTAAPRLSSTTSRVIYTTPTTTTTPRPTTSTTSSRLLIPTTSNLAYRPTVAPMQMTTDSLFSHYKQPEAPLRGPMYLIIEGHSKVKKYGKNGINLNLPKIVPVIPKREPVVRIAEPGEEKRGTPETFHVEHLHVKTSTTTTTTARPATTPKSATTATHITSTTSRPTMQSPTTKLLTTTTKPMKLTAVTNSTAKPPTSTTTTTARPAATTASPKTASTQPTTTKAATKQTEKSVQSNTTKSAQSEPQLKLELPNEPPTGMAGLLSLLDSSLGGLFDEQPLDKTALLSAQKTATSAKLAMSTPSTVLQAVNSAATTAQSAIVPVAANSLIGTNAGNIAAADTFDGSMGSAEFSFSTDVPPREVRQVFDYDQRPESRLKDVAIENYEGAMDEGASSAFYDDDEFGEYEDIETALGQPIKRMDRFVGDEEGEFVGDYEDVELEELGLSDVAPAEESTILVRTQAKMA
ncbi:mucin-5AC [Ceratitis capitata]|uniref:mucin-5AC n=1 Tax=Ceratitis capitata TaxID=7213 RepID=UPI0006189087|nr:mucin-5AC [Ceratitis capitata]